MSPSTVTIQCGSDAHTPRDITSGAKFRSVSRPVSQIVLSHLMMTNTHSLNVMALLCLIYTEHDSLNSTRLSQRTCPAAISPDWVKQIYATDAKLTTMALN